MVKPQFLQNKFLENTG